MDDDVKSLRWKKKEERDAAYRKKVQTKDQADIDAWRKIDDEYRAIVDAIKGGASTIDELNMALKRNVSVKVEVSPEFKKQEEEFDLHKDPENAFKEMNRYLKMVVKGLHPAVIISGAPGIGKTYRVKKFLKAMGYKVGTNLCIVKGGISAINLYECMMDYNKKGDVLLIDDADEALKSSDEMMQNLLKAALDSSADDDGRLVSYRKGRVLKDSDGQPMPKEFYYNGSVIVLTNMRAGQLDSAVKSRAMIQDMCFTVEELLDYIKKLIPEIEPKKFSMKTKMKTYDYFVELHNSKKVKMTLNLRAFVESCKFFEMADGDPDFTEDEVHGMIITQMKLKSETGGKRY